VKRVKVTIKEPIAVKGEKGKEGAWPNKSRRDTLISCPRSDLA
jgi:hypothetical protein